MSYTRGYCSPIVLITLTSVIVSIDDPPDKHCISPKGLQAFVPFDGLPRRYDAVSVAAATESVPLGLDGTCRRGIECTFAVRCLGSAGDGCLLGLGDDEARACNALVVLHLLVASGLHSLQRLAGLSSSRVVRFLRGCMLAPAQCPRFGDQVRMTESGSAARSGNRGPESRDGQDSLHASL